MMGSPISKARRNLDSIEKKQPKSTINHKNSYKEEQKNQNGVFDRTNSLKGLRTLDNKCSYEGNHLFYALNNNVMTTTIDDKDSNRQEEINLTSSTIEKQSFQSPDETRKLVVEISSSSSSSSSTQEPLSSALYNTLLPHTKNNTSSVEDKSNDLSTPSINVEDNQLSQNMYSSFDADDDLISEEQVYNWLSNDSINLSSSKKCSTRRTSSCSKTPSLPPHPLHMLKTPTSSSKSSKCNITTFTPPGWDSPLNQSSFRNDCRSNDGSKKVVSKGGVKDTHKVKQKNAQLPSDKPLVTKGDWLTNRIVVNNYIILHCLGEGSYGEVRLCKDKKSNELYAVKVINRRKHSKNSSTYSYLQTEVAIMKKLKHENCVNLYEVMDDPKVQKLYLVMEYMKGGDLMEIMSGNALKQQDIWDITRQIIRGLRYLHQNNIIHGDLKPQNLLVSSNGTIKIGDFGLSKFVEENQMQEEFVGTPAFVAPEVCSGESVFDGKKADMYSMGATIYYITFCKTPFEARNLTELYAKILQNEVIFPFKTNDGLEAIITGLMKKNPQTRLSMDDLIAIPWLQSRPGDPPLLSSRKVSQLGVTNEVVEISEYDVFNSIRDLSDKFV